MKDHGDYSLVSRRRCLKSLFYGLGAGFVIQRAGSSAGAADHDSATKESGPLIVRVSRPFDAETPVPEFTSYLTPNHRFFVRSHFGPPASELVEEPQWRLHVGGAVERPKIFTMKSLREFEPVTITAVLQCSGNGRAYHRPRVPGVQWERGAVGNAQWTGVRLRDVLQAGGIRGEAGHVQFHGADRPVATAVPLFIRSIPLEKALHSDTILAYEMNGRPLPLLHGAPLRAITPGWMAESCIKWLTHMEVRKDEATGYYMQTAYRVPEKPVTPETSSHGDPTVPVEEMPVKSLIAAPENGRTLKAGPVTIQGIAWAGDAKVVKVELSMNEGKTWEPARFVGEDHPYAWRQWQFTWPAKIPGTFTIVCRATDARGNEQPAVSSWNPSGFLWNGWDRITVLVNA